MANPPYPPISSSVTVDEIMKYFKRVKPQVDRDGLRIENKAEFTLVAPVTAGGAEIYRQRVKKLQTEAASWKGKFGTVHDLRIALLGDDHILFSATYNYDFKPCVPDVIKFATPWIDYTFIDVAEGFLGLASSGAIAYIAKYQIQANVWFASNSKTSVRGTTKAVKMLHILNHLLDTTQS